MTREIPIRQPQAIHATAIVLGEAGILIRGASRAGKSSVALALLDLAGSRGTFARLVGDDRVYVCRVNGRLMVKSHPAIAGKIERRGTGILHVVHEDRAIVRLVVDLLDAELSCDIPPRMSAPADRLVEIAATMLPRLALRAGASPVELAAQILLALPGIGMDS